MRGRGRGWLVKGSNLAISSKRQRRQLRRKLFTSLKRSLANVVIKIQRAEESQDTLTHTNTHTQIHSLGQQFVVDRVGKEISLKRLGHDLSSSPFDKKGNICQEYSGAAQRVQGSRRWEVAGGRPVGVFQSSGKHFCLHEFRFFLVLLLFRLTLNVSFEHFIGLDNELLNPRQKNSIYTTALTTNF